MRSSKLTLCVISDTSETDRPTVKRGKYLYCETSEKLDDLFCFFSFPFSHREGRNQLSSKKKKQSVVGIILKSY